MMMFNPGTLALFIPVLALSIPIVAIIANAYQKSHQGGSPEQARRIQTLEQRIQALESAVEGKLSDMRGDLTELEEKQQFIQKLLDDK